MIISGKVLFVESTDDGFSVNFPDGKVEVERTFATTEELLLFVTNYFTEIEQNKADA